MPFAMPEAGPVLFPRAPARSTARRRARPRAGAAAAALLAALALVPAGARAATLEVGGAVSIRKGGWGPGNCTTPGGIPFEGTIDFDMGPGVDPDARWIGDSARVVLDSRSGPRDIRRESSGGMTVTNNSNGTCRIWDFLSQWGYGYELTLDWPFDEMPLIQAEVVAVAAGISLGFTYSTERHSPPYDHTYSWWDSDPRYEFHPVLAPGDTRTYDFSLSVRAWMTPVQTVPLPAPAAALGAGLALLAGLRRRRR